MLEFELIIPNEKQIEVLYQHLCERRHNISHASLPNIEKHTEFVNAHPYRVWFIIWYRKQAIGNIYIQNDNSIGLNCIIDLEESQIDNILKMLVKDFKPLPEIPSIRAGKFFLNVSSSNIQLQQKLLNLGLIETQRSFIYETKDSSGGL